MRFTWNICHVISERFIVSNEPAVCNRSSCNNLIFNHQIYRYRMDETIYWNHCVNPSQLISLCPKIVSAVEYIYCCMISFIETLHSFFQVGRSSSVFAESFSNEGHREISQFGSRGETLVQKCAN